MASKVAVAAVLLVLGAFTLQVSAAPVEATYNFNYGFNASRIVRTTVNYTDAAGTALQGYFVYDNRTTAERPVVVIAPDYDGIGPYELWRANLVATLGYAAFVADIYGSNQTQGAALNSTQSSQLSGHYSADPVLLLSRIGAAVQKAQSQPHVKRNSTVAIGYCFGGSTVLDLAQSYPDNNTANVLGVVAFHTGGAPSALPNQTTGNPIRISVQQGYDDRSVSKDKAASIQSSWDAAGLVWEWTWYSQTVHAFTQPFLSGPNATATTAYNRNADERSWQALRFFLLDVFGNTVATNYYTNTTVFDTTSSFALA